MDSKKSISVIIPNYNGASLLAEYLPCTVEAVSEAGVAHEIIIVDDRSTDDSVNFVRMNYPGIKLILNAENRGFSYTCNRGIAAAQYELIFLLNSDVKLTPDYFDHQWKYFSDPGTFGVMGRIIDMEGDGIQDAARMPKFNGLKLKTGYHYYSRNTEDRLYTLYLSGANALVDAAKLRELGGFDEIYSPFYFEDLDLGIRAWRLGWKCYYEHQSICRHKLSATTKNYKTSAWVKAVYFRNRFYFHAIHFDGIWSFLYHCQVTLSELLPKLLLGQWWIWKSYRQLFADRKKIAVSKNRLGKLMHEHHNNSSLFDVTSMIRRSVSGKTVVRLKP
ncbi:MAG: glycosyltransferase family 2 protein [Bacteroidetes bacterium]|nr:glycosyltransferase family 2 protein [Bacteroidota bacterium]